MAEPDKPTTTTSSERLVHEGGIARRGRTPRPRSGKAVAIIVVGFSVAAAVAAVMARKASAPIRNAELQRVIADRAARVAARHPAVRVEIRTVPSTAVLELDGQKVSNPFVRTGVVDQSSHELAATLPGFARVRQTINFDRDRSLLLTLSPEQSPVPVR